MTATGEAPRRGHLTPDYPASFTCSRCNQQVTVIDPCDCGSEDADPGFAMRQEASYVEHCWICGEPSGNTDMCVPCALKIQTRDMRQEAS